MIIGIGIDLIEIDRIQQAFKRSGKRFLQRVFTSYEQEHAPETSNFLTYYAKRFAAKEAFLKALGSGLAEGISWQDLEIHNTKAGQPYFHIQGKALEFLNKNLPPDHKPYIHLSLSDTESYAIAMVLIETR